MIYLDTCIVIYLIEKHPVYFSQLAGLISQQDANGLAISSLVKLECLVKSLKSKDNVLLDSYHNFFAALSTLEISDAVFYEAAHIRADYELRTPDAIHVACAKHYDCTVFWTNDYRLDKSVSITKNVLK